MYPNLAEPSPAGNTDRYSRKPVAVVDPTGRLHRSISQASLYWRRSTSAVWRDCYLGRGGWRLAGEADASANVG